MTDKELGEIKRRFKPEKGNITSVRGCYINSQREVASTFEIPLGMLSDEQQEWVMKLLKKSISGTRGKNLLSIEFSTEQVEQGEEHKLLEDIRESGMENEELLQTLYEKIAGSYITENEYLILLAYDPYDIPSLSKNDEDTEDSQEMFRYMLCSICPLKMTKAGLGFSMSDSHFRNIGAETSVGMPEAGFMYPAFDDRTTNIYNAVFYTKSTSDSHEELVEALFGTTAQMPAAEQKEKFRTLVSSAAPESCSCEFVRSVHGMITDMITEHKDSRDPEPLLFDKNDVKRVLTTCGATETELSDFDQRFESDFGDTKEIPPANIIDPKQFEVKNSYVSIKLDPQYSFMLETKIIDGVKYIMVRADEGAQVNGISVHFDGEVPVQSRAGAVPEGIAAGLSDGIEDTAATTASYDSKE